MNHENGKEMRDGNKLPSDESSRVSNSCKELEWGEHFSALLELVLEEDGATCRPVSLEILKPRVGFAVALEGTAIVLPITRVSDLRSVRRVEVEEIRRSAQRDSVNLGFWVEKDEIWVEHSVIIDSLEEAIKKAESENQLAIFDFENLRSRYSPNWD